MTGSPPAATIAMPTATVAALARSDARLYAFRGVRATFQARPLVWQVVPYSQRTVLERSAGLEAYTCPSEQSGGPVRVGFAAQITIGQTLTVTPGGIGQVTQAGPAAALAIRNDTEQRFGCGLATRIPGCEGRSIASALLDDAATADPDPCDPAGASTWPYCHLPLLGQTLQILTPLDRVLMMFATRIVEPGTPADLFYGPGTFGPGILLTLAPDAARSVSYEIDHGWSWEENTWARTVPAGNPLQEYLIDHGPDAEQG